MLQQRFFSATSSASKYYKITLRRSPIGLSKDHRASAQTLGLFKLHQTSYQPANASTAGTILKLKELLQVENVDSIPTKEQLQANKPDRGYQVIGKKI
ncbi:hypothetical protein DM01DRAFT_1312346 [Hesseltinella vesiculosa]|uniref:Large ribosomal subunit protein uL30m n=1 Tax=Hesseltinella vesiculosa TaxID=101127 RepID=A0A1X2G4G1_9FUNG|nr:hypothetical protein DM01DRAFT_1312346 [Hesseltinella vesiculosa]